MELFQLMIKDYCMKQGRTQMKVLIVGSGGREHAIAWKAAQSKKVDKIYCAPGNAGIAQYATLVDIKAMEFEKLAAFAKEHEIDLTIVGMDDPLVGGIVDVFEAEGLRVFGPRKNAAILEGSKAFSKDLMKKYDIPTAAYENFDDAQAALDYLETAKYPIVLKADGLALGKGVLICQTKEEAKEGVKSIMLDKQFGSAGNTMVIEEFMTGREVSVLSFVDGKTVKAMTSAQDHKRAKDNDEGLNTGGMGTFSPSPFYTKEVEAFCKAHIFQKTVEAMAAEGREFKGIIFFGLMLTEEGPKVLEYNARFGDPEAQVVLPRMKNDIIDVMEACIDGTLDAIDLEFEDNAAVCVVLASDGYPVKYEKGFEICGLENFEDKDGYYVFHAGSAFDAHGRIVTNGGRVLGVTAKGEDLAQARANAYKAVEWVTFENKYYRHDIGKAIDEVIS
jgi:phosphoribosylamine--glycine ligase